MHAGSQAPLLRPGLLAGQVVAVAGPAGGAGRAAGVVCGSLGAHVEQLGAEGHRIDLRDEDAVGSAIAAIAEPEGRLDALVIDAEGLFGQAEGAGLEPLRGAVDACWVLARAAANRVMIAAPDGGKLVVIAPRPDAGPFAEATRAALENFSRTLSIEWARHAIRPTTIASGRSTPAAAVADLVAYLASPAGDYFSGCCFSLNGR